VKLASEFFALVEVLYVFLTRQKMHEEFVLMQRERQQTVHELGRLSDTRWACRHRNVSVLLERLGTVIDVLQKVQEKNDSDVTVHARGISAQVKTTHFVTCLVVFNRILCLTNGVNETLQSTDLTVAESDQLINSTITALTDLREHGWMEVWSEVEQLCETVNIDVVVEDRQKRKAVPKPPETDEYMYDNVSGQRHTDTRHQVTTIVLSYFCQFWIDCCVKCVDVSVTRISR